MQIVIPKPMTAPSMMSLTGSTIAFIYRRAKNKGNSLLRNQVFDHSVSYQNRRFVFCIILYEERLDSLLCLTCDVNARYGYSRLDASYDVNQSGIMLDGLLVLSDARNF